MPVTIDPKTNKKVHHSYNPTSKTYDKAIEAGHVAGANPHTGRKKSATKRSY